MAAPAPGSPRAPALLRQAVVGLIIDVTPKFPAAAGGQREKPCHSNRWLRAVLFYFNVLPKLFEALLLVFL